MVKDKYSEDNFADLEESKSSAMELQATDDRSSNELIPKDFIQYKTLRIKPSAERDFPGLIDKDVTLSNIPERDKPTFRELEFMSGTIDLINNILVDEREIIVTDEAGVPLRNDAGGVVTVKRVEFDKDFLAVKSFILNQYKFGLVATRGMGATREAVLDKTAGITKEVRRRRDDRMNSILGGGMNG